MKCIQYYYYVHVSYKILTVHTFNYRSKVGKEMALFVCLSVCLSGVKKGVGGKRGNGKTRKRERERKRERKMQCSVHSIAQFSNRIFPFLFLSVISRLYLTCDAWLPLSHVDLHLY